MDKEVVAHIHDEILLSHKKGIHLSHISNEVDEPRTYYTDILESNFTDSSILLTLPKPQLLCGKFNYN